jgi:hypothetical protein
MQGRYITDSFYYEERPRYYININSVLSVYRNLVSILTNCLFINAHVI